MPQQILIAEQLRIAAVLSDERVDELIVAQCQHQIGDVYLGTVENVHPGIDAAFVNIGESEKNGFIHVSDLGPLRLQQRAASITELLEPRQQVLVQVMKEPTGTKGPRLTGNIALPGRFLVLQPSVQGVNLSRRISSEPERNRLRALAVLIKPPGTGLLVRTEASGVSEEKLIEDLNVLIKQWEAIQQAAENAQPPVLLNRDDDFLQRSLRDHYCPDLTRVLVDSKAAVARARAFLGSDAETVVVEHLADAEQLLEQFRVTATIADALKPRVNLPSGGYVVIEPTEALTVIDVNSGSFTRSANARETVLWTNCEAATEIARQLRLRNLGGIVIVDFIDMDSRRDQLLLLEHFTTAMRDDKARPQIAQLTELGLVELTRKRLGQNIYEVFSRQSPSGGGPGQMATLPGIVRSTTLAPATPATGAASDASNGSGRRRRRGGGGRGGLAAVESAATAPDVGSNDTATETATEAAASRPSEPEVVTVPMNTEQEVVYSWMGFNPVLLAHPSYKEARNVQARVVGPQDNGNGVAADAQEPPAARPARRRRQRNATGETTSNGVDQPKVTAAERQGATAPESPSPRTRSRRRATAEPPATAVARQQSSAATAAPGDPAPPATQAPKPAAARVSKPATVTRVPKPMATQAPKPASPPVPARSAVAVKPSAAVSTSTPVRSVVPTRSAVTAPSAAAAKATASTAAETSGTIVEIKPKGGKSTPAPTPVPSPIKEVPQSIPAAPATSAARPVAQPVAAQSPPPPATSSTAPSSPASAAATPDATASPDNSIDDGRRRRRRRSSS